MSNTPEWPSEDRINVIGQNGGYIELVAWDNGDLNNEWLFSHGHRLKRGSSPTYSTWCAMKERCLNPDSDQYKNYGGRGIGIWLPWLVFANFLDDMGERPSGKTLDRIDVNGDYDPCNCKWSSSSEQSRNKRNSVKTEFRGSIVNLVDISKITGAPVTTVYRRYNQGLRGEDLVCKVNRNKKRVGEKIHTSKLTWSEVKEIREMLSEGVTQVKISKKYDVSASVISEISRNKSWKI